MTRTSASCRSNGAPRADRQLPVAARRAPCRRREAGFTILEMLVVLAIIAVLAGLVMPRMEALYRSWRFAVERQDVLEQIRTLGATALLEQRELRITAAAEQNAALPLELPDGWSVIAATEILIRPNGVCEGGIVSIAYGDATERVSLLPPYCSPFDASTAVAASDP